jgi:hypothetical protein
MLPSSLIEFDSDLRRAVTLHADILAVGLGPAAHAASIEAHAHHRADSVGSDCISCHMPRTAQTIATVNVRSHTFKFVTPGLTDDFQIPNPCLYCHADRNTTWARAALRDWDHASPWRLH